MSFFKIKGSTCSPACVYTSLVSSQTLDEKNALGKFVEFPLVLKSIGFCKE